MRQGHRLVADHGDGVLLNVQMQAGRLPMDVAGTVFPVSVRIAGAGEG